MRIVCDQYRGLHRSCAEVSEVLSYLNASRIAVGHTPDDGVRIMCNGRLVRRLVGKGEAGEEGNLGRSGIE